MKQIRLAKPYVDFSELSSEMQEICDSGILTRGKHVQAFQDELAKYLDTNYVFTVSSATTALWTALRSLNIQPGDEVIVSDFSFPATANVVEDLGARPIFADVCLDTFNLDLAELDRKVSAKTKAIIFVDVFGNLSGIKEVQAWCQLKQIPLIEDAACALGSFIGDAAAGSFGDFGCFSFHPRKLLTTGEGGAISTKSKHSAQWLEKKLMHGGVPSGGKWEFVTYGYNFRLSEIQALLGRKQLPHLDDIVAERKITRDYYMRELETLGFGAQFIHPEVRYNTQSVVFRVPPGVDRNKLIAQLNERSIEATIGTYCLSATAYYSQKYNLIQKNAYRLENETITLPCYRDVPCDRVVEEIKLALSRRTKG